jgi:hypothetical protein
MREAKRFIDLTNKPKLGLPGKKSVAPNESAPKQPALPELETIGMIAAQEFERANYNKSAAFEAAMARITADDALFRRLALNLIGTQVPGKPEKSCAGTAA